MPKEKGGYALKLTEKLAQQEPKQIWDEYCGFLTLDMAQYMHIQNRLMEEQIALWSASALGQRILNGKKPASIASFREQTPLTTYEDYAEVLLQRRTDMLPAPPVTWIETTWEGGKHPLKIAPYTQGMLDTMRRNGVGIMLQASASEWGKFSLGEKMLSGLAPLPYLTGLMGLIMEQEFQFTFMPPRETGRTMSFSQRSKLGIKTALSSGADYFLGMGSVSYFISKNLMHGSHGGHASTLSLRAVLRLARAAIKAHREHREILPKDLFSLRGFVCAGTDNACYKDDLEQLWGVRPMELFAGTECSLVGTETFNRKDLYFFPDSCFYEFLPAAYVRKLDRFLPTVTMDQVEEGREYELVVTVFKGGAFARYRTGDLYRCVGIGEPLDHSTLPRFRYIDRVPSVIDIAGFTRITENSIQDVIQLSHLAIEHWCAAKEFDQESGHPYLHMYVELAQNCIAEQAVNEEVLRRHLEIYFNYLDSDYNSLKTILEMEPLQITFLRCGTFLEYARQNGQEIERMNPEQMQLRTLCQLQEHLS